MGRQILHCGLLTGTALLGVLSLSIGGYAQQAQPPAEPPLPPAIEHVESVQNPSSPCVQPPPFVSWEDYDGPFHKVLGVLGQKIERRVVLPPRPTRYKPGAVLCSLETKEKFVLFVRDSVDPFTFVVAAGSAGISQATNGDAPFGQGAAGYGKRFGASFADQAQFNFFRGFFYPTIFSEDPRYYRMGQGSTKKRVFHALEHSFVAYKDNGHQMFNFSELLGNATGVALGNTYHPGARRGWGPGAREVGYGIAIDSGFDVVREFWPEFSRKFHLPFRYQNEVPGTASETPGPGPEPQTHPAAPPSPQP